MGRACFVLFPRRELMTRQYAVTVTASATEVDPETLAIRLADLLEQPAVELEEVIRGDTVILGRGLSYSEAIEIQRELSRRRIPAQVSSKAELSGQELWIKRGTDEEDDSAEGVVVEEITVSVDESGENEAAGLPDGDIGDEGMSAWAELFPDLATESPSGSDGAEEAAASDSLPELDALDEEMGEIEVDEFDFEAELPSVGGDDEAQPVGEIDEGWESAGVDDAATAIDDSVPVSPEEVKTEDSGGFDAGKIRQAFFSDEERPPFEPKGYDPRPGHVPLVAALLSLVAPGAGQVFNGQPEKGQHFAVMFIFVVPWIKAVRQAMRYGEKIRTYYAPRPPEGTAKTAVIFAVKWWVAVGILAMIVVNMGSMVHDHLQQRESQRQARVFQELTYYAQDTVADAVDDGQSGAQVAAEELEQRAREEAERRPEYTMDEEERARRLFIIGYHYCKGGSYDLCRQLMDRVTSLVPGNRDAFRLQAWAGIQEQSPEADDEIPEVTGEVPTLEEFEEEMATEGMTVEDLDEELGHWWNNGGDRAGLEESVGDSGDGEYGEWWDEWLEDEDEEDGEEADGGAGDDAAQGVGEGSGIED